MGRDAAAARAGALAPRVRKPRLAQRYDRPHDPEQSGRAGCRLRQLRGRCAHVLGQPLPSSGRGRDRPDGQAPSIHRLTITWQNQKPANLQSAATRRRLDPRRQPRLGWRARMARGHRKMKMGATLRGLSLLHWSSMHLPLEARSLGICPDLRGAGKASRSPMSRTGRESSVSNKLARSNRWCGGPAGGRDLRVSMGARISGDPRHALGRSGGTRTGRGRATWTFLLFGRGEMIWWQSWSW